MHLYVWMPDADIGCLPGSFSISFIHSFIHSLIWDIVCHWARSSSIQLAWLTSELQSCLSLPSTPQHLIKDTHYSPISGEDPDSWPHTCRAGILPIEPFLSPLALFICLSFLWCLWVNLASTGQGLYHWATLPTSHFSFSVMLESDWIQVFLFYFLLQFFYLGLWIWEINCSPLKPTEVMNLQD